MAETIEPERSFRSEVLNINRRSIFSIALHYIRNKLNWFVLSAWITLDAIFLLRLLSACDIKISIRPKKFKKAPS